MHTARAHTNFAFRNTGFAIAEGGGYGQAALLANAHPQQPHLISGFEFQSMRAGISARRLLLLSARRLLHLSARRLPPLSARRLLLGGLLSTEAAASRGLNPRP
jgi:hypothetical protein